MRKITLLIVIAIVYYCPSYGKSILPTEIMGRDLNYPGLGWIGHVALASGPLISLQILNQSSDIVIEILNETPVGRYSAIANFKAQPGYWGSKYGIADKSYRALEVLFEANRQIWLCPTYTSDTNYHVGTYNHRTGEILECGRWRCDTFVWWSFFSQGWDTMPGKLWLPKVLFDSFPYYNNEDLGAHRLFLSGNHRSLENVTADELNSMSFEEFERLMEQPIHYPSIQTESAELRFAYDENLNEVKRGIMLDRITSKGVEPNLILKLINLYKNTNKVEVKDKIVENLMLYNQQHGKDKLYVSTDRQLLRSFFEKLLYSDSLAGKGADAGIRGYIDTHSPEEIMRNRKIIDELLSTKTNPYASIMLKYSLVHKSKSLQSIYIKAIVEQLREAENASLDAYFFGPLDIGYQGSGKNLLTPESKKIVVDYLNAISDRYSPKNIRSYSNDIHVGITAPVYFKLRQDMGLSHPTPGGQ